VGEPLANYRNVKTAIQRIHDELGIGHRKITVSTVGIVPNIAKMATELPQVRLAVSLHCASDEERSALLPANRRNGGLNELMSTLKNYISTTGKRITLEWALIEGENDTPETAHQLGKLIHKWLRKDMVHVNVIPLNPTGGFGGSPSGRKRVNEFCQVLEERYSVTCTPRVRRGIDINAGCGQLKSEIEKKEQALKSEASSVTVLDRDSFDASHSLDPPTPISITFGDDEEDPSLVIVENSDGAIYMDDDVDWEDHEYQTDEELSEAVRLTALVKGTTITSANAVVGRPSKATSIPSA
jgi:wyosine [tRNA(Phe)-imidazoG37] synthetase (radical SAM superfamily)